MIYKKLKFKRTYIGGSKKNETQILNDVQGVNNNESECNWLEFKILLIKYFDDILNVILSWKLILNHFSIILIILSIIITLINPLISLSFFIISLIFQLISLYFKFLEKKKIKEYDFVITFIHEQTKLLH